MTPMWLQSEGSTVVSRLGEDEDEHCGLQSLDGDIAQCIYWPVTTLQAGDKVDHPMCTGHVPSSFYISMPPSNDKVQLIPHTTHKPIQLSYV